MRADQIMTTPVVTCESTDSLAKAASEMWNHDCGAVAIVNEQGRLVGMLTDRDICMSALLQGRPLSELPIHTAMSQAVFAATREVSTTELEELMAVQQIRRVPIVDADHRPIGLVSVNDLIRDARRAGSRAAESRIVQTLAAVGTSRHAADQAA